MNKNAMQGLLVVDDSTLKQGTSGKSATIQTFRLDHDRPITIGRMNYNHIPLDDQRISRRHCAVQWSDQDYRLTDLGSVNGTFLNGERVKNKPLRHGDVIRLGRFTITFIELTRDAFAQREERDDETENQTITSASRFSLKFQKAGFSGNLDSLTIDELVQVLHQSQKTGMVTIADQKSGFGPGRIYFERGEISHAQLKSVKGVDAVYEILLKGRGKFEFHDDVKASTQSIQGQTMGILLEAYRLKDEGNR